MSRVVPRCIVVSCVAMVFTGCGKPEDEGLPSRVRASAEVTYQGEPVTDVDAFQSSIARTAPDSQAQITVLRDGRSENVSVIIGRLTEEKPAS